MTEKNNDKIRVLSDREQAREKLPIFFGSRNNYVHGLKEVIANATDEIINHFRSGSITVILHEDLKTITVIDTGRGIPIAEKTDGIYNYELLFKTLFAGTKYDESENKTQTGVNGVGTTVLNYTSSLFKVVSVYGGKSYTIEFKDGGEQTGTLLEQPAKKDEHGTMFTFKLDNHIYPKIDYIPEQVEEIVKRYAVASGKVSLTYVYKDQSKKFHYKNLREYFDELIGKNSTSFILESNDVEIVSTIKKHIQPLSKLDKEEIVERTEKDIISICLTTTPEAIQESYLNLTYLSEGGSFNSGVIKGLRSFFNKYAKDGKLFPKGVTKFTKEDIENSFSFVITDLSNSVEFSNQTKLSTAKENYEKITEKHVNQLMTIALSENPAGVKKMCKHLLEIQKHNTQSEKAKKALKKKLTEKVDGVTNRVDDLIDCKNHGLESEIYIAEGQSALGSIVASRDAIYQGAYALRGKILNCLKASYSDIFKNKIITDLIKILGCGIEGDSKNKDLDTFNIKKLRFGKIVITTDQDSDGFQIACLIITMFYRLIPTLVREGYIYIAQTPLYEIRKDNDEMIYYYSESEKERELPKLKGKYTIARVKGLGELEPETMAYTAMNPETRVLKQVTVEDVQAMNEAFRVWLDEDVTDRKKEISENLYKYLEEVE